MCFHRYGQTEGSFLAPTWKLLNSIEILHYDSKFSFEDHKDERNEGSVEINSG